MFDHFELGCDSTGFAQAPKFHVDKAWISTDKHSCGIFPALRETGETTGGKACDLSSLRSRARLKWQDQYMHPCPRPHREVTIAIGLGSCRALAEREPNDARVLMTVGTAILI